MFTVECIITG